MNRLRLLARRQVAAALALVPLAVLAPAQAGAASDASDGGLWYYTRAGLAEQHQRSTGEGIKIAVLDAELIPGSPDLAGTDVTASGPGYCAAAHARDGVPSAHGVHMAALIAGTGAGVNGEPGTLGVAPGAEVEVFGVGKQDSNDDCAVPELSRAFQDAATSGADILNVSGAYDLTGEDMLVALRAGVIVVGAGGNNGVVEGLPARFNGAVTVGTLAPDLSLAEGSPTVGAVDVVAPGAQIRTIDPGLQRYVSTTGSSNATAFTSAALALAWSRYPDATANQILQSLIRNTGGTEHEPVIEHEAWGYGTVNIRQMLDSDPRSYPDVNPFIEESETALPSISDVREALGEPDPSPTPTPTSQEARETAAPEARTQAEESSSTLPVVLGAAGVVVAVVVALLLLLRRRRGAPHPTGTDDTTSRGHDG
ncbi:S8 family peptidase [Cellulomonas pakistanensis]|uniref:Type VII secretion-associated serine protease n=1 Tax=Cellulomonas pakistanensis TaxID=992287 RepID=A0A919P8H0_9CELL|nr:S8 family serine peptidase [Cellulomonas pakistanensis]GIG36314.1 type VII secretion-associated serine protease [Cellulomonas pakistanensis]